MEKEQLLERFQENEEKYVILSIGQEAEIVVTQRGGRVYGPFTKAGNESLFWVTDRLQDPKEAGRFLKSREWNTGGDRLWIGPEIRYSVADRNRFWETLHTPEAIDPGNYIMEEEGNQIKLSQEITLRAVGEDMGETRLDIRRFLFAAPNPLRSCGDFDALMEDVDFCGYLQRVCIQGTGKEAEGWSLLQVKPGGTVYIPMYYPIRGIDYYEPAAEFEKLENWGVRLRATGRNRYKAGYPAAYVTGRLGYSCLWNKEPCLLIRNFPSEPSAFYEEEPPALPGINGFGVHVYNDGNTSNGFSELECNLPGISGKTGREKSDDMIATWIFTGEPDRLERIAGRLLGVHRLYFEDGSDNLCIK